MRYNIKNKANVLSLLGCYFLWGFQPLYWSLNDTLDSFTILAVRIIMVVAMRLIVARKPLPLFFAFSVAFFISFMDSAFSFCASVPLLIASVCSLTVVVALSCSLMEGAVSFLYLETSDPNL